MSALYSFFPQIFYREHYCYNHTKKINVIKFLIIIITTSYWGTKLKVCFLKGQNKTKQKTLQHLGFRLHNIIGATACYTLNQSQS